MSATFVKVMGPSPMVRIAGAPIASEWRARLERVGRAVWRVMEKAGQARASGELSRLAAIYAHRPEFAQQLRDAARRTA